MADGQSREGERTTNRGYQDSKQANYSDLPKFSRKYIMRRGFVY